MEATKWFPLRMICVRGIGLRVEQDELAQRLKLLKNEHRDLDKLIAALSQETVPDMMQIARQKKRKLLLRDEIAWIEDQQVPDIIA